MFSYCMIGIYDIFQIFSDLINREEKGNHHVGTL